MVEDKMTVGIVTRKGMSLSRYAEMYIASLRKHAGIKL